MARTALLRIRDIPEILYVIRSATKQKWVVTKRTQMHVAATAQYSANFFGFVAMVGVPPVATTWAFASTYLTLAALRIK